MFVVILSYQQPLTVVDEHLADHRQWLDQQYADGVFLASGPRQPRTGGVILADGLDRAELDARLETDPFHAHGVASYEVVEFSAVRTASHLAHLAAAA